MKIYPVVISGGFCFALMISAAFGQEDESRAAGFILPPQIPQVSEETPFRFGAPPLETAFSLRQRLPEPADQALGNSCMGWTVGYGLLSLIEEIPQDPRNASYVYHWARLNEMKDTDRKIEDLGCEFRPAFEAIIHNGSCRMVDYSDFTQNPSPPVVRSAKKYRALKNFSNLSTTNIESIKLELAKGKALPGGFLSYRCFNDQTCLKQVPHRTTGKMFPVWNGLPPGTFPKNSGHAMLVIGYDDDLNAFEVMNSFGKNWGDGGYVWIDYEFFSSPRCCVQLFTYDDSIEALVDAAGSMEALKRGVQQGDIEGYFKLGFFNTSTGVSETNFILDEGKSMDSLAKFMIVKVDPKMGRVQMRATLKSSEGVSPVLIGPIVGTLEPNDRVEISDIRKFVNKRSDIIEFWIKGRILVD